MTTSFPTSKQSLPNPTGAQDLDDPAYLHSDAHSTLGDTVEELQDYVKFDGASSLDGRITAEASARTAADSALDARVDALALDDLTDVDVTTTPPADGDRLAFDVGSGLWLPTGAAAGMLAFDDLTDVDLTGVADGDVPTYDLASGTWLPAAPAGGGGSTLLARNTYGTATDVSVTSTSGVDVDATNAAATFTAPESGAVLVRLSAQIFTTGPYISFGIREGASDVVTYVAAGQGGNGIFVSLPFVVTGLTPASSHTYKFAAKVDSGTGHVRFGGSYSAVPIEIWAA